ncbi:hypothetical protein V5799_014061 [Amblyomma americanum]|uniref:MSP domain-containing protein n=1 Tax=Amblyomma americanum TaxID=6943 RepID=A0AAQ4E441_AMBAM
MGGASAGDLFQAFRGPPLMAAELGRHAPAGRMPVVVCPSQIDFYVEHQDSHKQVLTLYNINEFPVYFQLLSNAPRRYAVAEPEGMLKPHSFTDVVVRHREASEANVGRRDHLRIIMREEGGQLHGHRDVPATLHASRRGESADGGGGLLAASTTGSVSLEPTSLALRRSSRAGSRASTSTGASPPMLVVALACLVALLLPLEGAGGEGHHSLLPAYLQLSHQQKLVAAYILGGC